MRDHGYKSMPGVAQICKSVDQCQNLSTLVTTWQNYCDAIYTGVAKTTNAKTSQSLTLRQLFQSVNVPTKHKSKRL